MNIYKRVIFFFVPVLMLLVSCTKTEYETIKRPYNAITKFSVAGYGNLDSVDAAIFGNEIRIYWNSDSPLPTLIKPTIHVSDGATVSPASGSEVAFTENTTYTVTAEDGTMRTYKLKPIVNQPSPILNGLYVGPYATDLMWIEGHTFNLMGEYFLSTDINKIKVYGQRIKDGFEFDVKFNTETATSTSMAVSLPDFTAAQDTGWHRIWLKAGELTSDYVDIYIRQPFARNVTKTLSLVQEGQPVKIGQEFTMNYAFTDQFNGAAARYLNKNFSAINITIQGIPTSNGLNNGTVTVPATNITFTDNQVKFTLPETATSLRGVGGFIQGLLIRPLAPIGTNPNAVDSYTYLSPDKTMIVELP